MARGRAAAGCEDGRGGRADDPDLVGRDLDIFDLRTLARVEPALLQCLEQRLRSQFRRLHLHPAAESVGTRAEVGVVRAVGEQPSAEGRELVAQPPAVAAVVVEGRGVVVDLDRVGRPDRQRVRQRQRIPGLYRVPPSHARPSR